MGLRMWVHACPFYEEHPRQQGGGRHCQEKGSDAGF